MFLSIKECEKEIRDGIRQYGLVFKKSKSNNLYIITDRKTKEIVLSNCTLSSALNNLYSGYLSCYDCKIQAFDKQQLRNLELID